MHAISTPFMIAITIISCPSASSRHAQLDYQMHMQTESQNLQN